MYVEEEDVIDFLEHHGVKGMRWGVRREDRTPGVPRATDKEAQKDAEEFARAKMFYGEGAGTRRKLIQATVDAKSKKDPLYKKAFDNHLSKQDMSEHSKKARDERATIDRKTRNKQRLSAIARKFTNERGTQAAIAIATVATIAFLARPEIRQKMKSKLSIAKDALKSKQNLNNINSFLRNSGFDVP